MKHKRQNVQSKKARPKEKYENDIDPLTGKAKNDGVGGEHCLKTEKLSGDEVDSDDQPEYPVKMETPFSTPPLKMESPNEHLINEGADSAGANEIAHGTSLSSMVDSKAGGDMQDRCASTGLSPSPALETGKAGGNLPLITDSIHSRTENISPVGMDNDESMSCSSSASSSLAKHDKLNSAAHLGKQVLDKRPGSVNSNTSAYWDSKSEQLVNWQLESNSSARNENNRGSNTPDQTAAISASQSNASAFRNISYVPLPTRTSAFEKPSDQQQQQQHSQAPFPFHHAGSFSQVTSSSSSAVGSNLTSANETTGYSWGTPYVPPPPSISDTTNHTSSFSSRVNPLEMPVFYMAPGAAADTTLGRYPGTAATDGSTDPTRPTYMPTEMLQISTGYPWSTEGGQNMASMHSYDVQHTAINWEGNAATGAVSQEHNNLAMRPPHWQGTAALYYQNTSATNTLPHTVLSTARYESQDNNENARKQTAAQSSPRSQAPYQTGNRTITPQNADIAPTAGVLSSAQKVLDM